MKPNRARWRSLALTLPALLALPACNSCERDAPYTPYRVEASAEAGADASPPPSAASAAPDAAPPEKSPFQGKAAMRAPTGATTWRQGELNLEAPKGYEFEQAVFADWDGDEKPDAVTWSLRKSGEGAAASLWFHPAAGKPRELSALAPFIPTGDGCRLTTHLEQSGMKTVTLITRATCSGNLLARIPISSLTVVEPTRPAPVLLELRLADVAKGERRQLLVVSTDRDDDGQDDVSLKFRLERGGATATASFGWFQRAQGLAVEDGEPARSLNVAAQAALAAAKKTGQKAQLQIDAARRLWSNLCAEGRTPRLFNAEGAAITCRAETALAVLNEAEVRGALKDKQPLGALGALERDGWFGRFDPKQKSALLTEALKGFSVKRAAKERLSTRALGRGPELRFSPLSYEASGALLVQRAESVTRLAEGAEPEDVTESIDHWPLALRGEGGTIMQVLAPCDSPDLMFVASPGSSQTHPIPLLSPRPGMCGDKVLDVPRVTALSFGKGGFEGYVAGAPVGEKNRAEAIMRPHVLGSARSPDGKHSVVLLERGLVILSSGQPELWELEGGTSGLGDCVIKSGGREVACVDDDGHVVRVK